MFEGRGIWWRRCGRVLRGGCSGWRGGDVIISFGGRHFVEAERSLLWMKVM